MSASKRQWEAEQEREASPGYDVWELLCRTGKIAGDYSAGAISRGEAIEELMVTRAFPDEGEAAAELDRLTNGEKR